MALRWRMNSPVRVARSCSFTERHRRRISAASRRVRAHEWASAARLSPPRLRGQHAHPGAITVAQHAADCRALLKHLGIERSHVVGHSCGGAVALQLALDSPDLIESLALLEPAVFGGQAYLDLLSKGQERFRREGAEVVIDDFLRTRFGADYRPHLIACFQGLSRKPLRTPRPGSSRRSPVCERGRSTSIRRSGSRSRSWLCSAGKATHYGLALADPSAPSIVAAQCRGCRQ